MPKKAKSKILTVKKQSPPKVRSASSSGGRNSTVYKVARDAYGAYAATGGNIYAGVASGALSLADSIFSAPKKTRSTTGPMTQSSVAVPANIGVITTGSTQARQRIVQTSSEGLRLSGTHYVGIVSTDTVPIPYLTAAAGGGDITDLRSLAEQNVFGLACNAGTNTVAAASDSNYYHQRYFCPTDSFLETMGRLYAKWRPVRYRVRFIPQCPTSTKGTFSMAYTPIPAAGISGIAGVDMFGATPGTYTVMSQLPSFTSGPVWQQQSLDIFPTRNGICNAGQYLNVVSGVIAATNTLGDTDILSQTTAGSIIIMADGFTEDSTTYGHVYLDYDVEFLSHTSLQSRSSTYGLSISNHKTFLSKMTKQYQAFCKRHSITCNAAEQSDGELVEHLEEKSRDRRSVKDKEDGAQRRETDWRAARSDRL